MSECKTPKEQKVKISLALDAIGCEVSLIHHGRVEVTMSKSYASAIARGIDHELTELDRNTRRFYNNE